MLVISIERSAFMKKRNILIIFSITLVLMLLFTGCNEDEGNAAEPNVSIVSKSESRLWPADIINADGIDGWIPAGEYLVGTDLPAGEYFLVQTDSANDGYLLVKTLGDQDTPAAKEQEHYFHNFCFVTVSERRRFIVENAKMIPADKAPPITADADGFYGEGTYRIGKDLPAGEYYFEADPGVDFFVDVSVSASKTHSQTSPEGYIGHPFTKFFYITVKYGEYLQVCHARFTSAEQEHEIKCDNGVYPAGHYLVGRDIPAGKYILLADEDANLSYYEKYSSSRNDHTNSIRLRYFKTSIAVRVIDGEYLAVFGATFTIK